MLEQRSCKYINSSLFFKKQESIMIIIIGCNLLMIYKYIIEKCTGRDRLRKRGIGKRGKIRKFLHSCSNVPFYLLNVTRKDLVLQRMEARRRGGDEVEKKWQIGRENNRETN